METERLENEWDTTREKIKTYEGIDPSQINAFFSRLHPQAMSDGFLMITAENDFIKTWVERHYLNYITRALKDVHGIDYTVVIEVDSTQQTSAAAETTQNNSREANTNRADEQQENGGALNKDRSDATDGGQESSLHDKQQNAGITAAERSGLNSNAVNDQQDPAKPQVQTVQNSSFTPTSNLTFENFVIGSSNKMAYSMAVAVAEEPGASPALNPLFIYGKSGLGKTHLLRSIQNYIDANMPQLKTVYVDSAQLLDDYMNAAATHDKEKQSYRNFKNTYEGADVLLIDDVQYLQGKKQTLEIVFQIFNNLTREGKQVILSADRAPKNIDIDERYSSRFNSGGTFDIQPPEFEVKLGIVRSFIEEWKRTTNITNIEIDDGIQRYIAENSSSNIRELKSAVTKVIVQMTAFNKQTITLEEVKEILRNHFTGGAMKKLTVADIQKEVESYYKVSHADLIGKKRSRNIVYARQVAIYLCRQMLDIPYNTIGKSFGGKDHTTVLYSVGIIEEKLKENLEIREELESIKQMIQEA